MGKLEMAGCRGGGTGESAQELGGPLREGVQMSQDKILDYARSLEKPKLEKSLEPTATLPPGWTWQLEVPRVLFLRART
jgi:hypothetical protein